MMWSLSTLFISVLLAFSGLGGAGLKDGDAELLFQPWVQVRWRQFGLASRWKRFGGGLV